MSYTFKKALVRKPSRSITNAISSLGANPDYEKVIEEHINYKSFLLESKVEVFTLEAIEEYPDSVFVEYPSSYSYN